MADARRVKRTRARRVPSLDSGQWRTIAGMAAVVLGLHALGFGLLIAVVAHHHHHLATAGAFAVGTGLTAYTLGLRHAFDADHISAIDNTTRNLMGNGRRPLSVGFFFSLGHSTVVFVLAFLFAVGLKTLGGQVTHHTSALHNLTSWIGTGVSGTFLYVIAALNAVVLWGVIKVFREMRKGHYDEQLLEQHLNSRGLMGRLLGRFSRAVQKPWQMYPLGLLFGLGFDTATEVALLFLAASAAGAGLSFSAILCLPILFAAGMSLLDTADGSFMNFAYGWAFSKPLRKVFYNLTITGLSVAVALVIGTIELGGLLAQKLNAHGPFWTWLERININTLGFIIVGMFLATWAIAVLIWRLARVEERWSARLSESETSGQLRFLEG
jgi:nickel/cobalt transporter (NiCoT) family protein